MRKVVALTLCFFALFMAFGQSKAESDMPDYDYEGKDVEIRIGSRAIYSITAKHVSRNAKMAVVWVGKNRQDDDSGVFPDELRYVYLQREEFQDYDPNARRTDENNEIAKEVLNAWQYENITGDSSYRLVPKNGVKCSLYFVGEVQEIRVFDMDGNTVYDSGSGNG